MTLKEWKSKYRHIEQKAANGDVRISVNTVPRTRAYNQLFRLSDYSATVASSGSAVWLTPKETPVLAG